MGGVVEEESKRWAARRKPALVLEISQSRARVAQASDNSICRRRAPPILAARHVLYAEAREDNRARWSRQTHGVVTLSPERDAMVATASDRSPLAA